MLELPLLIELVSNVLAGLTSSRVTNDLVSSIISDEGLLARVAVPFSATSSASV